MGSAFRPLNRSGEWRRSTSMTPRYQEALCLASMPGEPFSRQGVCSGPHAGDVLHASGGAHALRPSSVRRSGALLFEKRPRRARYAVAPVVNSFVYPVRQLDPWCLVLGGNEIAAGDVTCGPSCASRSGRRLGPSSPRLPCVWGLRLWGRGF